MKTLSEQEIAAKAKAAFKFNPQLKELHCTVDGQCFASLNAAKLNPNTKGKRIYHFNSSIKEVAEKIKEAVKKVTKNPTAEERIETVKAAPTIEAVQELLKEEKAKTVQAAGADRIAELKLINHTEGEKTDNPENQDQK